MKQLLLAFVIFTTLTLQAQLNRYPYIQSTAQTSTIVAWKTANSELGSVAYGLDSLTMLDTLYEATAGERHAVTIENLSPDTKYYYRIMGDAGILAGEHFYTASDETDDNFSFIHYGDCGYNSTIQHQLGDLMEADDASFAVICGDIDQGGVPHISQSEGGDNYDDIYFDVYNDGVNSKMLSKECHYTAIGNHDYYANNGATYDLEFHLPHNNAENSERYYSFTWGDAKFIALDIITPFDPTAFPINFLNIDDRWWTDFRPGSPQYNFLEEQLQCNDSKWTFVYFHEGPWTNYWGIDYNLPPNVGGDYYQFDGNAMVRQHLVPLFEQYNVDIVMCGHSHLYEKAEKNGVMYITSGSAGSSGGNTMYNNHPEIQLAIIDNIYVKYTIDDNEITYDVINKDNVVIDTFARTKTYTPFAVTPSITSPSCFNAADGAVNLTIDGPQPPYTVEWFDGAMGPTRTGMQAGSYYAYVRNAYGCEKVTSITVVEPALLEPLVLYSDSDGVFCEDESITLSTLDTYVSYNWSNGSTDPTNEVFLPGNYTVTVVDANGCVGTSSDNILTTIPSVDATFGTANALADYNFLCFDENGSTYTWDFGDGTTLTESDNLGTHTYAENGSYEAALIIENECFADTFSMTINVTAYPDTAISIVNISELTSIQLYPNPASNAVHLAIQGAENGLSYQVLDLLGREVETFTSSKELIAVNTEQYPNGTYFIKVATQTKESAVLKFIVQH